MRTCFLKLSWAAATLFAATAAAPGAALADEVASSPALRAALAAAVTAAVTVPGARADVVSVDAPKGAAADCPAGGSGMRFETTQPIEGSGRVALKMIASRPGGKTCEVWAWARVKVFADVPIARRAIRAGEVLAPAVRIEEREIRPGHVPASLTAGAVAERSVGVGQMIEADVVRAEGPRAGEAVKILLVSGALTIEQTGRAVACGRNRACAVLPSGKHIEGTFADGRLLVQLP